MHKKNKIQQLTKTTEYKGRNLYGKTLTDLNKQQGNNENPNNSRL